MEISIFQVDAFTQAQFSGNPAAVCPLLSWLPNDVLQGIAAENNLSETAFFVPTGDGSYHLRWFTPNCEVDLCGHATLASAYVLFHFVNHAWPIVRFHSKAGELTVERSGDRLAMNFPSWPPVKSAVDRRLRNAMGGEPSEILAARDYLVRYRSRQEVEQLAPAMDELAALDKFAVIATAPGDEADHCDFVSRFFAPAKGIPEDPVTGSAHCSLVPYWAAELGKTELHARQISKRGGELFCKLLHGRVELAGYARLYLRGSIFV